MNSLSEQTNPSQTSAGSALTGHSGDDTMSRLVRGAHETVDRVAAKAAPVVEQVKGSVDQASEAVHHRADQLGQLGHDVTDGLRSTVRDHPLASLAVALAVGVIVSRVGAR